MQGGVSFYRRPLPATCTALSSTEGRLMFSEALAAGTAECFFPLIEQARTIHCIYDIISYFSFTHKRSRRSADWAR